MHKMCKKTVATVVIAVAFAMAALVSFRHDQSLNLIIFISRFFDVMIPVLAVGALIKYLIYGGSSQNHDVCKKN